MDGDNQDSKDDFFERLSWGKEADLLDLSELDARDSKDGLDCSTEGKTHAVRVLCNLENGEQGFFASNVDGKSIGYGVFKADKERAALIIATGRTETRVKYAELIYDLQVRNPHLGYSVYILDHRGQGFSDRLLDPGEPDETGSVYNNPGHQKGYVDQFDDYVADLHQFVDDIVVPKTHAATFILAHSLGGGITTRFLQTGGSEKITAAILTSPMHGIAALHDGPLSFATLLAVKTAVLTGFGEAFAIGGDVYSYTPFADLKEPQLTRSETRYELWAWIRMSEAYAPIRLGSATNQWLLESHFATELMIENAKQLDLPVLILQAEAEKIVSNDRQVEVCDGAPDCSIVVFPGAEHEIMIERDDIREAYFLTLIRYMEDMLEGQSPNQE